jgi:hypothetical protein
LSLDLLKRGEYRQAIAVLQGKASPPAFCTSVDAYVSLAEMMTKANYEIAKARKVWEYILTLDETIPANRIAQIEARKRLQETESVKSEE